MSLSECPCVPEEFSLLFQSSPTHEGVDHITPLWRPLNVQCLGAGGAEQSLPSPKPTLSCSSHQVPGLSEDRTLVQLLLF